MNSIDPMHDATQQRQLFLLGPQPEFASLKKVIDRIELSGPVALITAGWETDEHQDHELKQAIGVPSVNLNLFARTEQLFAEDAELIETLRERQDQLRHLRETYNRRLTHLLKAARQIIRRKEKLIDLTAERESAIEMVRQLDQQYFDRTSKIVDHYEQQLQTSNRTLVASHRQQISEILEKSGAILISGGHVAIILNRLRIFGILESNTHLPLIAWSGGSMALAEKVVLFHDSPPQGAGNSEVLRAGMGLFTNVLPLPNAEHRLKLKDKARVELFARRFESFECVVFSDQTILERVNGNWNSIGFGSAKCLGKSGNVVDFNA